MEIKEKEEAVQQQYLTFFLADEEYAIGIQRVKEIIEYTTTTKVPKVPAWIRGVINLRGNVVPVVDLAVRFGLEERPVTKTTCIVVVEVEQDSERTVMGVIADAVNQVIDLAPKDIEEPPAFGTRVRLEYLFGMGKLGKKFALILNIDSVLSAAELLTVSTIPAATVEARGDAADNSEGQSEAT
jgi:purine-binding chemotaxis protein CheW